MAIDSQEITDFIDAVKLGIAKSREQGKFDLISTVEFELSVVVKKEGEGKFNIAIVGGGGKYEKEAITKIKFSMGDPNSYDELRKLGEIMLQSSQSTKQNVDTLRKFKEATNPK